MSAFPEYRFGGTLTESSSGGRAVFFDMDGTLTACNTGRIYAEELWRARELNSIQWVGVLFLLLRYRFGVVRLERVMDRIIREGKGKPEDVVLNRCLRLAEERVIPDIFGEARVAVAHHLACGDHVAILSASSEYMIRPVADELGIETVLATPVHVKEGLFTGEYDGPICYGEGKVAWAERYCSARGLELSQSTFYTDSYTDLPVLERVMEPISINPDPRLERVSKERKWPIHWWT